MRQFSVHFPLLFSLHLLLKPQVTTNTHTNDDTILFHHQDPFYHPTDSTHNNRLIYWVIPSERAQLSRPGITFRKVYGGGGGRWPCLIPNPISGDGDVGGD
uniref:(northern house mosquito) hypothetical protein n=1 Tax=Culex pipiens TaxID=7175 RepID=A0A8D8EWQ3_CULPI